jgi:uncharacterized protein (DUF2141 family)
MKRRLVTIFYALLFSTSAFSQAFAQTGGARTITVEIRNVAVGSGTVHFSVMFTQKAYDKRTPDKTVQLNPASGTLTAQVELPAGDCVISAYQDSNGNGKQDNNLLGIPREPVGISNWNGRGVPGNFDKHKISINDTTQTIIINLYTL